MCSGKFVREHPVLASAVSIGMAPLQGAEFMGQALGSWGHSDTGDLGSYVPINALQNKAKGVTGTYTMAGYATDSAGRELVGIVTVEQYDGNISGIKFYDVTHAVSGRQKNTSLTGMKAQAGVAGSGPHTRPRGFTLSTLLKISIADFLETVKQTHQSILSEDVLAHFGEERNPAGYYTGRAQFSLKDTDSLVSDQMTDALLNDRSFVDYLIRADRINTIARELGVRVRFVDGVRGGRANAGI